MNEVLLETAFDGATADGMEDALWRILTRRQLPIDIGSLTEVVVKLGDNAIVHSGDGGGSCSVQLGDRPGKRLTVVIADRGVGIPARVNQMVEDRVLDDHQALLMAFERRFSTTGDPHRGFGLNIALDYTGRVPGSALTVESGHAVLAASEGTGRLLSKGARRVQGFRARLSVPRLRSGEGS